MSTDNNNLTITLNEEELFNLFCEFGALENKLANFLLIIEALQEHYEDGMLNEKYAILTLVKSQLIMMHDEIYSTLKEADTLLLKKNK